MCPSFSDGGGGGGAGVDGESRLGSELDIIFVVDEGMTGVEG